jgi:predicted transposase YdaD
MQSYFYELVKEEGLQEGRQEGRQEGLQEGIRLGVLQAITFGLDLRFGTDGLRLLPEIENVASLPLLRAVQEHLKTAQTPEELRRIYRDN